MLNLFESKTLSIVILGVASVIVGVLPACFARQGRRQWPLFLSSLLCFGGGVLLSTSLVHILPEMKEAMPQEYRGYSELLFCAGFFLLYVIDEIVHYFNEEPHDHDVLSNETFRSGHRHSTSCKNTYGTCQTTEDQPLFRNQQTHSRLDQPPAYNPSFYRARSDSVLFNCCDDDKPPAQLACHVGHQEPCHAAPTAAVGLLAALSAHALLEGLAVGLEPSASKVLLLLGAISSHKLVVGFCLGVELVSNAAISFCKHFMYILIFALGSVVGIIIGMLISNIPEEVSKFTIPICQGLAGGTLLYVTVCEIIPRERARWHKQHEKRQAGIIQFTAVTLGFCLMTILSKYLDREEDR
ncbi:unnamed protein product [Acanthoscelides obtectus]|uniref:Uncharacterized protein n=1 Tax=Acanthoscelides obtectus TaxID=200917 RepID=A0A9P0P3R2_ACAOB|nr:unnamed protein product [Acanthoscelides obtectus]CAK1666580.1 Protein zntD [Acanthoscelides obtectus]